MPAIVLTGVKEVDRALRALGPKVANGIARKGLRDAAKLVKAAVEADAPRGESGDLRASVKVRAGRRSRNRISVVVTIADATFRGQKYYAAFVEYGAAAAGIAPRGYMRRAYDTTGDDAKRRAIADIKRAVEDATR